MDVFSSKLCCANLDAVTGKTGAHTPKMPGRSPSSRPFALMPNSAVGRIDLPKASTGYPEDASAGASAKAVHIPAEEDCRLRFLRPQDNKVPWERLQLLPHRRRRSGPTSASTVSGRR